MHMSSYDLLQLSVPIGMDGQQPQPHAHPDCPLCPYHDKAAKASKQQQQQPAARRELRYDWVVDRRSEDGKVCEPSCAFTASGAYSCVPGRSPESKVCTKR